MFGDQAYWKEADRQAFAARGVRYRINRRPNRRPLSERWRLINRARSLVPLPRLPLAASTMRLLLLEVPRRAP